MADRKFKIKGKGNIPDFDSDLEIEVNDRYEAYSKPVPDPTPYEDGHITWFNAFGIRDKATRANANVPYRVTLQKPPMGKRLFVLYDDQPHEITPQSIGPDRVMFNLNIGDPPTGTFP
jgi:hypothetical protein